MLKCISSVRPKVFLGIPKAHIFLTLFKKSFSTIEYHFCVGNSLGLFGPDILRVAAERPEKYPTYTPREEDLAAIIFTTGSTGPPKGVRYEHSIFSAQLKHIQEYYSIGSHDIDQPAFPLFALFSIALGACAVIPDMDSTKPAKVNPEKYVSSLIDNCVTYSFASPALWNVVTHYCIQRNLKIPTLRKILMAGAPVSGELIEKMYSILPEDTEIFTPYGATECLPIVSIEGREIVDSTWMKTKEGKGTCVGRPLPGMEIVIIEISDLPIENVKDSMLLEKNQIGEIIVSGDVVTRAYDGNEKETKLSKTHYHGKMWHRIGDTGYLDSEGRLWFCGRKGHRVKAKGEVKYTIPCEAIINTHPDVFRSALVGIRSNEDYEIPVIIVELKKNSRKCKREIMKEIQSIASLSPLTSDIEHFLFHRNFPVDIRHNAKIFREKLSVWAAEVLQK